MLAGTTVITATTGGAVSLAGAHITGQMNASGARLENSAGAALHADGLRVDGDLTLRNGFTAAGAGDDGAVRLLGARIGGQLDCTGAEMSNPSGPALNADGLQVSQGLFLREGFTASGAGEKGTVRLMGAHVTGQFSCRGAHLTNPTGAALLADNLQVSVDMFLDEEFTATGGGSDGAVRLLGAHIGVQFSCSSAVLTNPTGPALLAKELQVDGGLLLGGTFTATGAGDSGAVNMVGAHIIGSLDCDGAQLSNSTGPALRADGLRVDGNLWLSAGFSATGAGEAGAVRLVSAHIAGRFSRARGDDVRRTGRRRRADRRVPAHPRHLCRGRREHARHRDQLPGWGERGDPGRAAGRAAGPIRRRHEIHRDPADANGGGNHRKNLRLSLETSLRRLRTDHIDVLWMHIWDRHTPIEETMRALDDAVTAGKVLYIGVSDTPAWVVSRANTLAEWRGWNPLAGLQVPYSLINRDAERELLPMAEASGLTVTAWSPLDGGVLSGKYNPGQPAERTRLGRDAIDERDLRTARVVAEVAGELNVSPAQVALAWTRRRDGVLPIIGARTVDQLRDNLACTAVTLPPDLVSRLEAETGFSLGFPADFIAQTSPWVLGAAAL